MQPTPDPLEAWLREALDESPLKRPHRWPDPVMNFIIAYDIADPKRLREVAKALEQHARRVQKSVFVFTGSRAMLDSVIRVLMQRIDTSEDRIQAWPIRTSTRSCRIDAGLALPETGVALIASPASWLVIEAIDDAGSDDHQPLVLD
jgi:CRISPR-associated protein Cas2